MVAPLKFGNGYVIPSNTLLGIWLLIHAGFKFDRWCIDFHKYETYHCLNQEIISFFLFALVGEVFQLSGGK